MRWPAYPSDPGTTMTIHDLVDIRKPTYDYDLSSVGCIVMCDVFCEPGAIDAIHDQWLWLCSKIKRADFKVMLVRTKADLRLPCVEQRRIMKWCVDRRAAFVSTSSKVRINIHEVFKIASCMALQNASRV